MNKPVDRDKIRKAVASLISKERLRQAEIFPPSLDDRQVQVDLLDLVAVLAKYTGHIADDGVKQRDGYDVDYTDAALNAVKVAAVAAAILESMIATGKVDTTVLRSKLG